MDFQTTFALGLLVLATFLYTRRENRRRIKELEDSMKKITEGLKTSQNELRRELNRDFVFRINFENHRECLGFVRKKKVIKTSDWTCYKNRITTVDTEFSRINEKENEYLNRLKGMNLLINMQGIKGSFALSKDSKDVFKFLENDKTFINESEGLTP